jgi:hypothetical protein
MLRGKTARTVVGFLAAVLLCFPFLTPTAAFASAHAVRDANANAALGKIPTGKTQRDEVVTHRKCHGSGDPIVPLRRNDRYRTADPAPPAPERPLLEEDPASAHEPLTPVTRHHRAARSETAHTPAALQVFRC